MNTINNCGGHNENDISRVSKGVEALPKAGKDAVKTLEGEWREDWNSNYGSEGRKTMMKFISFRTLPSMMVNFFRIYHRVTAKTYEIVTAFTMPGTESVDAAMVLCGKITKSSGTTCTYKFDSVRLVPSDAVSDASIDMLSSAGLSKFLKPQPLASAAPETSIEIHYISEGARVHEDENGVKHVLSRLTEDVPGIPFKLD